MNNNVLAVEQNKYTTKVVNAYIVDDADNLNPLNNFVLKIAWLVQLIKKKIVIKLSMFISAMDHLYQYLVEQVHRVFAMTFIGML